MLFKNYEILFLANACNLVFLEKEYIDARVIANGLSVVQFEEQLFIR